MGKYIYLKTKETLVTFTEFGKDRHYLVHASKKEVNSIVKPVSYG